MYVYILTLRRPNLLGLHMPVSPDHSDSLTNVFGGAKNDDFS